MSEHDRIEDLSILGPLAGVLRRRWIVMVLVPLLATVAAVVMALRQAPDYASTARVLISDRDLSSVVSGVPTDPGNSDRAIATAVEIAGLPVIQDDAEAAAGPVSQEIRDSSKVAFDVVTVGSSGLLSNVIEFTVTANDREYARRLSTELANTFVAFNTELSLREIRQARDDVAQRVADLRAAGRGGGAVYEELVARQEQLGTLLTLEGGQARVLAPGDEAEQVGPKPVRNGAAGLVLGLLIAAAAALGIDRLDRRVRSVDEIADTLGLPVLGRLDDPRREAQRGGPVTIVRPGDAAAEAFRTLRANLRFALGVAGGTRVAVTSALEAEGKTSTCCNLGVVSAASGLDVVVVDLDLRRPRVHSYLGLHEAPGTAEVVAGDVTALAALRDIPQVGGIEGGRLRVLTSGTRVASPGELAASQAVARMLAEISADCDMLIVDVPPALAVGDTLSLAGSVDAFLVVASADRAERDALRDLKAELAQTQTPVLGVVLTSALSTRKRYAYDEKPAPAERPAPARRERRTGTAELSDPVGHHDG
ncbi:MAG: P-loop NTPase [Thermoleophilia bacterium]